MPKYPKLTDMQMAVVDEYFGDLRAAVEAAGYRKNNIRDTMRKLERNPLFVAAITAKAIRLAPGFRLILRFRGESMAPAIRSYIEQAAQLDGQPLTAE